MALVQKIGKYEIQSILGKGGMGAVYRAFDPAISRSVAIKAIVKNSVGEEDLKHIIQRFRHEAQAVGRLVHPRIVQIYDYGEDDEVAYIVMELVNGKPLSEHLAQETSYEIREVGEIIRQLLDGIGHAHAERVIHRDIKPSNILVNSDGRIKLSDFGIARIRQQGYLDSQWADLYTRDNVPIDVVISPEREIARAIAAADTTTTVAAWEKSLQAISRIGGLSPARNTRTAPRPNLSAKPALT